MRHYGLRSRHPTITRYTQATWKALHPPRTNKDDGFLTDIYDATPIHTQVPLASGRWACMQQRTGNRQRHYIVSKNSTRHLRAIRSWTICQHLLSCRFSHATARHPNSEIHRCSSNGNPSSSSPDLLVDPLPLRLCLSPNSVPEEDFVLPIGPARRLLPSISSSTSATS